MKSDSKPNWSKQCAIKTKFGTLKTDLSKSPFLFTDGYVYYGGDSQKWGFRVFIGNTASIISGDTIHCNGKCIKVKDGKLYIDGEPVANFERAPLS